MKGTVRAARPIHPANFSSGCSHKTRETATIVAVWNTRPNPVLRVPAERQKNHTEEETPLTPGFEALLLQAAQTTLAPSELALERRLQRAPTDRRLFSIRNKVVLAGIDLREESQDLLSDRIVSGRERRPDQQDDCATGKVQSERLFHESITLLRGDEITSEQCLVLRLTSLCVCELPC